MAPLSQISLSPPRSPSPFAVALLIYVWPIGLAKKSFLRLLRRISFFCLFDLEAVA